MKFKHGKYWARVEFIIFNIEISIALRVPQLKIQDREYSEFNFGEPTIHSGLDAPTQLWLSQSYKCIGLRAYLLGFGLSFNFDGDDSWR